MSRGRRPTRQGRPTRPQRDRRPRPVDIWRSVPELDEPAPITRAGDPTALLRSLGPPPLPGQAVVAERYLAEVVTGAARLATALATAADLLADPDAESG